MTYSPIHDDDICDQVEPLLDAATVPATIVNWAGDEPVSVQEYCKYFGELLGVEAEVVVTPMPGASRGSVGGSHQAQLDHRPVQGRLARRLPPGRRALLPRPRPARERVMAATSPDTNEPDTTGGAQYPSTDELLAEATAATGLDDFGPGDFRVGADVLLESLARDAADLTPAGDCRRRRWLPSSPREPPRSGGVVPRPPRDRGPLRAGPDRHQRSAPHRHHGDGQHDVARSAVPLSARVGAGATVPATDDGG